jgi:ATP-binding cassette, subfamily B, multidrug efflux pump
MFGNPSRVLGQETRKARSTRGTIARFGSYFKSYWYGLVLVLVFILISSWANILGPELIGQAVDCYIFPQQPMQEQMTGESAACWFDDIAYDAEISDKLAGLGKLSLALLGLFVLDSVIMGLSFFAMRWTGQNVLRKIRTDMFRKIHRLSMGYYAKNEAGDVMSRVTNDMDTVQQMFNFTLLNVVRGVFLIVFIMFSMFRKNVPYALISLSVLPVMVLLAIFFSSQARKAFRTARKEIGSVTADLQESISGAREVQAFNREEESIAQFQERNEANRAANVRAAVFTSALHPMLDAMGYLALGIVVFAGGMSALRNEPLLGTTVISLGTMFAFVNYSQRLNQPVMQIAVLWTNVQNGIAGGERIFSLMDEHVDISDKSDAPIMPEIKGDVVFEKVSMQYVENEEVLKEVSFHTRQGEVTAFVGHTGAGKTTIANLIPRFYDVNNGAVKIDGLDVRDVQMDTLRDQVGIVLQDTFLFSDSVLENIRYGKLDATDEEVIAAAKMVAAHDFIERLPEGYETVLGERGSGLSQGQRQLVAIARVALMNPNILILDEATSSVDTRTERVIQAAFEKLLEGRTSFVIAHRLSTIKYANQIIMLEDGEIVERGTHHELLETQGAYYDLYVSQFRDEDEAGEISSEALPTGD